MNTAQTAINRVSLRINQTRWMLPALLAVISLSLVAAAIASEYLGGQAPCKLCYIQRFPHVVTGLSALVALRVMRDDAYYTLFLGVCALAAVFGTFLSVFHLGGELGLWDLSAACQITIIQDGAAIPVDFFEPRAGSVCAQSAWRLLGLPMAGFNSIASLGLAALSAVYLAILWPRLDLAQS